MQKHYLTYVTMLVSLMSGVVLLIMGTLFWGDPYGLYHSRDLVGLEGHDRLVKPHWMVNAAPSILLVGSSRAQILLDPDLVTSLTGKRAFNASLSGANIYEVRRMVDHALGIMPRRHGIETIIVGLDFYMFNENRRTGSGFDEARLSRKAEGETNRFYNLADLAATLLSRDALDEWRRRIKYRDRDCQALWSPNGGRLPKDYECALERDNGQQQNVRSSLREYMGNAVGLYGDFPKDIHKDRLAELETLIAAIPPGTDIILYISPVHLLHLEMVEIMGLWPTYAAWRRGLVTLVEAARANGKAITLWDFARETPWTAEDIFTSDRGGAANFYDSHHLHARHRQHYLEILLEQRAPTEGEAVRLTSDTINGSQEALASSLRAWARLHPSDMAQLRELYADRRH